MTETNTLRKLIGFVKRLRDTNRSFHLDLSPFGAEIRVHTWVSNERWEIDFDADGKIVSRIFRNPKRESYEGHDVLENLFDRLRRTWLEAAKDLDIRFEAPFIVRTDQGREVPCCGRLPDFGNPRGMVITSMEDPDEAGEVAHEAGYRTTGLNPRYYETYDRELFVETLLDWGYYGPPERRPSWIPG